MTVKGIVFDKDGTLMEYEPFWGKIAEVGVADILKKIGADVSFADDILLSAGYDGSVASIDGIMCCGTYDIFSEMMWHFLKERGISVDKSALKKQVVTSFHNAFPKGEVVPICDNLREVLLCIKSKGIKTALATNDDIKGTMRCLQLLGISDVFDRIYADDGIFPPKPDPYMIKCFCNEENIKPQDIIVVGDSVTDMLFAKNAGAKAIAVAKNEHNRKILEQYARVIDNISELI